MEGPRGHTDETPGSPSIVTKSVQWPAFDFAYVRVRRSKKLDLDSDVPVQLPSLLRNLGRISVVYTQGR